MDRSSPAFDPPRDRLPTLYEVLARKTKPPVDLFSFYIYMRDQQRSVDYLDFCTPLSAATTCPNYVVQSSSKRPILRRQAPSALPTPWTTWAK
ncbi:MAG: hypothetical protein Q9173_006144 [Seirophora scorigena]